MASIWSDGAYGTWQKRFSAYWHGNSWEERQKWSPVLGTQYNEKGFILCALTGWPEPTQIASVHFDGVAIAKPGTPGRLIGLEDQFVFTPSLYRVLYDDIQKWNLAWKNDLIYFSFVTSAIVVTLEITTWRKPGIVNALVGHQPTNFIRQFYNNLFETLGEFMQEIVK